MVMVDKKGLGIFVYMVDFICIGSISCIVDDFRSSLFLHSNISDEIKI
jgi:hypothetical protein